MFAFSALCSIVTASNFAAAESKDIVSSRIPAKIHVIQNFEDWNDVQIRISGMLRNTCYTKEETTARVEGDQILVENMIRLKTDIVCLTVLVPYSDKVSVRNLKEGVYDVLVKDKYGTFQEMTSFKTE